MSVPLVIVRPEPGASATCGAAREIGLDARAFPLSEAEAVPWTIPQAEAFDGLLIGSANAIRLGGPNLAKCAHLPVHAVGEATADAAREAGLAVAQTGVGGLQGVVDALSTERDWYLLRLTGESHVPLDLPPHVTCITRVAYRMSHRPFPPELVALLHAPAIVALHSADAARHFRAQCEAHAIAHDRVMLAALGPRVAAAAGPGWGAVACAAEPRDAALLAMAKRMWHTAN